MGEQRLWKNKEHLLAVHRVWTKARADGEFPEEKRSQEGVFERIRARVQQQHPDFGASAKQIQTEMQNLKSGHWCSTFKELVDEGFIPTPESTEPPESASPGPEQPVAKKVVIVPSCKTEAIEEQSGRPGVVRKTKKVTRRPLDIEKCFSPVAPAFKKSAKNDLKEGASGSLEVIVINWRGQLTESDEIFGSGGPEEATLESASAAPHHNESSSVGKGGRNSQAGGESKAAWTEQDLRLTILKYNEKHSAGLIPLGTKSHSALYKEMRMEIVKEHPAFPCSPDQMQTKIQNLQSNKFCRNYRELEKEGIVVAPRTKRREEPTRCVAQPDAKRTRQREQDERTEDPKKVAQTKSTTTFSYSPPSPATQNTPERDEEELGACDAVLESPRASPQHGCANASDEEMLRQICAAENSDGARSGSVSATDPIDVLPAPASSHVNQSQCNLDVARQREQAGLVHQDEGSSGPPSSVLESNLESLWFGEEELESYRKRYLDDQNFDADLQDAFSDVSNI